MKKIAVIIGAGPAGLTCAYDLLKRSEDIFPLIVEEENFVGGISRTATYKNNRMDIGGHRFFTKDDRVMNLWNELLKVQGQPSKDDKILNIEKPLVENGPDPEKEDEVMLIRNRVSRIYFLRKFFDYPISLKARTFINMGFLRTMKAGFGYIHGVMFKKDESNLENFYINRFGRPLYEMFFEDYTEKLWGVHPSEISADWGAQRVKGVSISKAIKEAFKKALHIRSREVETSLIEQYMYPKKGPGQLYEILAKKVIENGGEIRFDSKVTKVNLDESNRVTSVVVSHKDGSTEEIKCDFLISSMPIKDLVTSIGEEKVPSEIYKNSIELPYRDFMTVGLLLNKIQVKNKTKIKTINNIIPDCWIYVQERDVKLGRIQIFNNWSPYMVDDFEHKIWIGLEYFCNEGDEMWNSKDSDFISNAIDELIKIGFIENKEAVLDSTLIRVKKAYPAYFGSYEHFDDIKKYLNDISNLYCIGRNGQHRYNNMDHSMLSALVCNDVILNVNKDKESIWNVNTEKSYHESK